MPTASDLVEIGTEIARLCAALSSASTMADRRSAAGTPARRLDGRYVLNRAVCVAPADAVGSVYNRLRFDGVAKAL
jgi:hypothetical protein